MAKTPPPRPSPKQIRELKGLAHGLKPVLRVGKNGYGPGLKDELDQALLAHELIKVKFEREAPIEPSELATHAARDLGSFQVGSIGKTLILYRPHPKAPRIVLGAKNKNAELD
jgi:RNA-binding protein